MFLHIKTGRSRQVIFINRRHNIFKKYFVWCVDGGSELSLLLNTVLSDHSMSLMRFLPAFSAFLESGDILSKALYMLLTRRSAGIGLTLFLGIVLVFVKPGCVSLYLILRLITMVVPLWYIYDMLSAFVTSVCFEVIKVCCDCMY